MYEKFWEHLSSSSTHKIWGKNQISAIGRLRIREYEVWMLGSYNPKAAWRQYESFLFKF